MYQSPIRLAGITGPITTRRDLQLARKKMLAELELSNAAILTVNERKLSRQDIIHLFDELGDERQVGWHQIIFQDKALMQFLENAVLTTESWRDDPIYEMPDFQVFVSPFFAEAVNVLVRQCLKQEQPIGSYHLIVQRHQLLRMQDVEQCFTYAHRFFLSRKAALTTMANRLSGNEGRYQQVEDPVTRHTVMRWIANEPVDVREIEEWCTPNQIALLNALPDEHFGLLRHDLASRLNDLSVICDKAGDHYRVAYAALKVAFSISCPSDLQHLIRENMRIIYSKMKGKPLRTSPANTDSSFSWQTILFILIVLFRLASCMHNAN